MKRRSYFRALEVSLTSAPPLRGVMLHSEQALGSCLLVGTELIGDWIPEEWGGKKEEDIRSWSLSPR
jgi:hypothetical protein